MIDCKLDLGKGEVGVGTGWYVEDSLRPPFLYFQKLDKAQKIGSNIGKLLSLNTPNTNAVIVIPCLASLKIVRGALNEIERMIKEKELTLTKE